MKHQSQPVLGMVLKGFPRISETFISNEILLLEGLGFKIHLFSLRDPRESFCHESVKQIKAKVDYLPQTISGNVSLFLRHNLALAIKKPVHYARALKTAIRRFRRTRKSATIKHLLQAGYVVNHLAPKAGITHFHSHFAHSPTSVAMFAAMLSGLEFSFTGHAKDIYTSDERQLSEKIDLAKFVVTCTEYNRRYLLSKANGSRTPVYRIYHGIDTDLFSESRENYNPQPPFRILTVARIAPKKGLKTVFEALSKLRDMGVDFKHTLIGDGDERDTILALIKDLNLEDRTEWLGTLPHEEVLKHYRRADLFMLGCRVISSGDRDGIPNVFLEAMAMGVPVLATGISGIPELIESGNTGMLVEPEDAESMAQAARSILEDAELRKRIIPAGRRKIIDEFDNKKLIGDLAEIYRNAGI